MAAGRGGIQSSPGTSPWEVTKPEWSALNIYKQATVNGLKQVLYLYIYMSIYMYIHYNN